MKIRQWRNTLSGFRLTQVLADKQISQSNRHLFYKLRQTSASCRASPTGVGKLRTHLSVESAAFLSFRLSAQQQTAVADGALSPSVS